MDEFLMRTLKRIIKYHEDKELELLLKPLVKKWAKDFINEKYKEGIKYYIELGDKLFTRGLIEINSADSAQSNFANRIVSMESLNNINGYASVVIRPKKDLNEVKTVDNRRDSVDIVMKNKDEDKASVVGLDIDTLNDKCVKVLKEAKDVNATGKGVEKCLKKLVKLQSLIDATLNSQKDIDPSKREWFVSVEKKMSKVIERFNELLKEQKEEEENDKEEENEKDESDSDSEIHNISVVKKNSKKHIKEEEEEEEEKEEEKEKRPRRKTFSSKHILEKENNQESKSRNQSKKHLKEEQAEKEQQEQQQQPEELEKEKEKKHKHHKHHKKEEKEEKNEEEEEEYESQLPAPPPKMHNIIIPPPDAPRQRTISLPSPSDESSSSSSYNKPTQRRKDLTKSISDMSILSHNLNLSEKQLSKSTSHLTSRSGKPPLSPASIKKKNLPKSPLRNTIGPIPQRQFSPNNPFLNPQIVNNNNNNNNNNTGGDGRQRANSDQVFNNTPILVNPFLKPPPPPAPRIPNFNNPLKMYLDTSTGKLEPIEERDSNWDLGNNDLDIKDIIQKKESDDNNNLTNPFLRSTTPKSMSNDHITGKNPFESPVTPLTAEENTTTIPAISPIKSTTAQINTTPINPFLKLQKTPSDQSNPFQGLPDTNPFRAVNSDSDSAAAAVPNNRIRSNSMPANATSFNIFTNPNFMNQTTVFSSNTTKSNVINQQPSLAHPSTECRKRFSTNPFDMVDDEDVIKAANEAFTPDPPEEPKQEIETEKVEEKVEEEVEEKEESNSDLFASMFASTPEPQKQEQSTTEEDEKEESNSDLFNSMFDSIPETQKQDGIEEQIKPAEIESPKKAVSDKFISSMLNTIPDNIQAVDKEE